MINKSIEVINARGERVPGERPGESVEQRAESIFKVSPCQPYTYP